MLETIYIQRFAIVSGLLCGAFFAYWAYQRISNAIRINSIQKQSGSPGILLKLFSYEIPGFYAMARRFIALPSIHRACDEIARIVRDRHIPTTPRHVCACIIMTDSIVSLCAAIVSSIYAWGVYFVCNFIICCIFASKQAQKRRISERESIPEALRIMQSCFQSGYSIEQTFQELGNTLHGSLGHLFLHASHMLALGQPLHEALSYMNAQSTSHELSFVLSSLAVQHQSGGSMESILDAAGKSVSSELDLQRELRVQTAQARTSYHVILLVTITLVGMLVLITDNFFSPFFSSSAGVAMLIVAMTLLVGGIVSIKRLLHSQEV